MRPSSPLHLPSTYFFHHLYTIANLQYLVPNRCFCPPAILTVSRRVWLPHAASRILNRRPGRHNRTGHEIEASHTSQCDSNCQRVPKPQIRQKIAVVEEAGETATPIQSRHLGLLHLFRRASSCQYDADTAIRNILTFWKLTRCKLQSRAQAQQSATILRTLQASQAQM